MYRDVSSCNTYNYGDASYWDARYVQEAEMGHFDWYQRYSGLRPFIRMYIPSFASRILVVGCGNALMSEDMVKDGYEDITNIDISSVAIEMMRRKYECIPQLKYMQMDVRDMSFFPDESFDSVIDKARPGFRKPGNNASTSRSYLEPVPLTEKGLLPPDFVVEDPDSHFIYVCKKMDETELSSITDETELSSITTYSLDVDHL